MTEIIKNIKESNIGVLVDKSGLPLNLRVKTEMTPDSCDSVPFKKLQEISENILSFIGCGKNLYIYSKNTGNGKTTWAANLMLEYFNSIWGYSVMYPKGVYVYVPTLMLRLKTQFRNDDDMSQRMRDIKNANLLILDDIGVGKLTDFDLTNLLDIIDYRLENRKSTIFTSNVDYDGLIAVFGERLVSRIYEGSLIINFKGTDKRGKA